MSDIKQALMRKLGPLPAWAWALIGGVAIYMYRTRHGSAGAAASVDTTSPDVTDQTGGRGDPITLGPGESAYDPNTGQLVSAAPDQQAGGGAAVDPQSPITLEPGEAVYDPNTGELITLPKVAAKAAPKKKPKRKPKAKPHHKTSKHVPKPGHGKKKPRGKGKLIAVRTGRVASNVPRLAKAGKARVRGKATARPSGAPRARAMSAKTPSLRQRPAPQRITHPTTQRSAPHPAHAPTPAAHPHAPAPAQHPHPRRRRRR